MKGKLMCVEFDTDVALVDRDGAATIGKVSVLNWTTTPEESVREVPAFGQVTAITGVEAPNLHLIKTAAEDGTEEYYLGIDLQTHSDAVEDNGTVHPDLHVFGVVKPIDIARVVEIPIEL